MTCTWIDPNTISPAPYNPRHISKDAAEKLKASLNALGPVLPVIVNHANNTIIAGHQRRQAAIAANIKSIPAYFVKGISVADEMTFNQLHNGTDMSADASATCCASASASASSSNSFTTLPPDAFAVVNCPAPPVKEICKLILRYGNVFCAVICARKVYIGVQYVKACQCLGVRVNVCLVPDARASLCDMYLSGQYGVFSYDALPKSSWVQGLAQLNRHVTMSSHITKRYASQTYERLVMPYLSAHPEARCILDFGCGKGAYITHLLESYPHAIGYEPYNNDSRNINIAMGNAQAAALAHHLRSCGLFDVAVCDSVLNSVDCPRAETSILICLCAFLRIGGVAAISSRPLSDALAMSNLRKSADKSDKCLIRFLDGDNYTAIYRAGNWYYQHYHTRETLSTAIVAAGLLPDVWQQDSSSIRVLCTKVRDPSHDAVVAAINYEFSLPLPNGKRYNCAPMLLDAWSAALTKENL